MLLATLRSVFDVEREVDEAIGVTQVDLHPVELRVQVHSEAVRHHFHPGVARLDCAVEPVVVEGLIEQVREAAQQNLPDSDRRRFFVPLLESFGVFGDDDIAVLIDGELGQLFV